MKLINQSKIVSQMDKKNRKHKKEKSEITNKYKNLKLNEKENTKIKLVNKI